jgi:hypothetical protein
VVHGAYETELTFHEEKWLAWADFFKDLLPGSIQSIVHVVLPPTHKQIGTISLLFSFWR